MAVSHAQNPEDYPEGYDIQDWDCQFFVYVQEKINVGDEYRLTMRIRADKAANSQTQAHNTPGDYNHYQEKGYAPIYARENFENCWKRYHALGANGVMDDIHKKFLALPVEDEIA